VFRPLFFSCPFFFWHRHAFFRFAVSHGQPFFPLLHVAPGGSLWQIFTFWSRTFGAPVSFPFFPLFQGFFLKGSRPRKRGAFPSLFSYSLRMRGHCSLFPRKGDFLPLFCLFLFNGGLPLLLLFSEVAVTLLEWIETAGLGSGPLLLPCISPLFVLDFPMIATLIRSFFPSDSNSWTPIQVPSLLALPSPTWEAHP